MTGIFWEEYSKEVLKLENQEIRPLCEPKLLNDGKKTPNSIVLIHGLSDSPFSVTAIAEKFYKMGFNVFLPLLPGHGLKDEKKAMAAMTDETLFTQWKEAVKYAVAEAKKMSDTVSIGGLSTGGALSTHYVINHPDDIQGALFLFSAALDFGDFAEIFVRKDNIFVEMIKRFRDKSKEKERGDFVGNKPHAYAWAPTESSERLSELILEIEQKYPSKNERYNDINQPVFAVHSECDEAAGIEEVQLLIDHHPQKEQKAHFIRIKESFFVTHFRVVLEENLYSLDNPPQPIESKNPFFPEIIEEMKQFVSQHLS
ncbi:MAG: alpha/beta hydrolase [Crocosphaera sp.]|nr:alpha/beta hydrolase [Crocosphaera sp.]